MNKPRFHCAELTPGVITLDAGESKHARQSLRLRPGDEAILFDGRGRVAHGTLRCEDDTAGGQQARREPPSKEPRASFTVEHVLCEPPPSRTLTLIVAGCKGPRLRWMVEKLTELGTTRIVLADFEHSVVQLSAAHAAKLRRTVIQAARQSQRAWLPEITCGGTLEAVLAELGDETLLVAHPLEEAAPLSARLHACDLTDKHLTAVVGPEGGLSDTELAGLLEAGGELVRLAPTILRVETTAVSLAANWAARQPG